MPYVPYSRVKCNSRETQDIDNGVSTTFASIANIPFLQNLTTIEDIVFTSGTDTYVEHKLGKPYRGYFVIKNNSSAVIYESSTANTNPTLYVILKSSTVTTATLMFF